MSIRRMISCTTILLLIVLSPQSRAENARSDATQIGTELNTAYKRNTTEAEYAYMAKQAALAHGGKSFEEVLDICAEIVLSREHYSPGDILAVLVLAQSLKANDEKVFTSNVKGASIQIAMQIHADILDCAMPGGERDAKP